MAEGSRSLWMASRCSEVLSWLWRSDGRPTTRAAVEDGAKVTRARRRKETTYPELVGRHARARLVVMGVEVGGRFSTETQSFSSQLARAKARCENSILRKRVEQAWRLRWESLLACTTAGAVASSLLGLPSARGADGGTHQLHTTCVEAAQEVVSVIM